MHHCYIIREHGLDFWCIRLLTPLGGSNLLTLKIEGRLWLLPQQLHLQRLRVWMLIHLPNEEVKPGNLKPSHILASREAGLKDCAPSPGLLIFHFFHALNSFGSLINCLKWFRGKIRFRKDIHEKRYSTQCDTAPSREIEMSENPKLVTLRKVKLRAVWYCAELNNFFLIFENLYFHDF